MFIGEIGINHNGELYTALQLIQEAKRCGVDVVKFQKRDPDLCIPELQKNVKRVWKGEEMTYLEYKKSIEFGKTEYDIINQFCQKIGIKWTVSVWDVNSVEFMKQYSYDIPFIKIPSACITDMELIHAINDWGIPVIISDGMSTEPEVLNAIYNLDNLLGVLHCNSTYPCADDELDLNVITRLKNMYPTLAIGYSGHEIDMLPTLISVIKGADIIERHITLDKAMEGTDHKCSLDIAELEELISQINRIPKILGTHYINIYGSEKKIRDKLRKQ